MKRVVLVGFLFRRRVEPAMVAVFAGSRVNGGGDHGAGCEPRRWAWPEDTWLRRRLELVRRQVRVSVADLEIVPEGR